ncbi:hypothetical protein NEPTK9_001209 [Candidatus Neptunochlamydia vexilliferae]|uniref:Uncharacterized protein n=1 Tax=Candidatus Neptunichlamydia vexilliferae TaxID=1651774 RepID=A0ABS0AZX8_9BACT|nr:hypothetical protein [Candidatus Neptunochlamydia vexilliferae]
MNARLNFSFFPGPDEQNDPYFIQVCNHFVPLNLKKNRKPLQAPLVLTPCFKQ